MFWEVHHVGDVYLPVALPQVELDSVRLVRLDRVDVRHRDQQVPVFRRTSADVQDFRRRWKIQPDPVRDHHVVVIERTGHASTLTR
jgi:hypothetical protein